LTHWIRLDRRRVEQQSEAAARVAQSHEVRRFRSSAARRRIFMPLSANEFDLLQEFIEHSERAANADDLAVAFQSALERLGFRYFACCSHVDPQRPPRRAVLIHSYPSSWTRLYSEQRFFEIDPVFRHADTTLRPFFWDGGEFQAGLTREQRDMLAQAAKFGVAHGFTTPLHPPCSRVAHAASCSVIPDSAALELTRYYLAQLMSYFMYDIASRQADAKEEAAGAVELSNRERQCLELVAQGKSDWVVGKLLSISERTVHNHIERAKRRLGVTTRVQAIVHALATRQISFGDVIKAEPARTRSGVDSKGDRSGA
jgi:DNA-binding CsgD family transcriptional regulator